MFILTRVEATGISKEGSWGQSGTEKERLLNVRLVWTFLLRKAKGVASSWKETIDAETLDVADSAQGKPRGKILCEDVWDTIRWKVPQGSEAWLPREDGDEERK